MSWVPMTFLSSSLSCWQLFHFVLLLLGEYFSIHIYIYIHTHIFIHTHIYMFLLIYIYTYICFYIFIYVHIYMFFTYLYIYIYIYILYIFRFLFLSVFFLPAAPVAYGSSWSRNQFKSGAVTYATAIATLDPNPLHWARNRTSSTCTSWIINSLCHSRIPSYTYLKVLII